VRRIGVGEMWLDVSVKVRCGEMCVSGYDEYMTLIDYLYQCQVQNVMLLTCGVVMAVQLLRVS